MLRNLLAALALLSLGACATIVPTPASPPAGRDPQAAWASVLQRFVDEEGRTDFQGLAAGCPRLPREPFTAAGLDAELDREAREFFAEPRNLVVEPERQAFRVSEILSFFTGDFLAVAPSLPAYINRYRDGPPIPDGYKAEFIDYDWRINNQPKNLRTAAA